MQTEYFVRIENPKHTRKQLLQVGRLAILTLRNQKELQSLRSKKVHAVKVLENDMAELNSIFATLNSLLPDIDLSKIPKPEEPDLPKFKPRPKKKEETKPKKEVKPTKPKQNKGVKYNKPGSQNLNSEVERLEYTLNKIENTIKNLDS